MLSRAAAELPRQTIEAVNMEMQAETIRSEDALFDYLMQYVKGA